MAKNFGIICYQKKFGQKNYYKCRFASGKSSNNEFSKGSLLCKKSKYYTTKDKTLVKSSNKIRSNFDKYVVELKNINYEIYFCFNGLYEKFCHYSAKLNMIN